MNTVYLDARVESDLDWRVQLKAAESLDHIIWHLDLGFFDRLRKPIDDEGQYRSLRLALDHFVQKVWPHFDEKTRAVMVYKGILKPEFPIEHLVELVELLPDEIPLMAEVTTQDVPLLVDKAFLLSSNRFGRIQLQHDAPFYQDAPVGVLLPSQKMEIPIRSGVRLLSESCLTLEWDGLDELHVYHEVDATIMRKLQGFQAAGGIVKS
jgi:hypothetical protein